jgi:DNA polymerase-1
MSEYPSVSKKGLEADDVMGILSTKFKGRAVIVSIDKDMKTIPGKFYHLHPDKTGTWHETSEKDADYSFLLQALMGDAVDGYGGVPGIGPKTADKLLKKHGAVWKTVEDAYIKAGLTKEDALVNARMARILRQEDWDFEKEEVRLWEPPN